MFFCFSCLGGYWGADSLAANGNYFSVAKEATVASALGTCHSLNLWQFKIKSTFIFMSINSTFSSSFFRRVCLFFLLFFFSCLFLRALIQRRENWTGACDGSKAAADRRTWGGGGRRRRRRRSRLGLKKEPRCCPDLLALPLLTTSFFPTHTPSCVIWSSPPCRSSPQKTRSWETSWQIGLND